MQEEKKREIYAIIPEKMGTLYKTGSLEELSYGKTAYGVISMMDLCTGGSVGSR